MVDDTNPSLPDTLVLYASRIRWAIYGLLAITASLTLLSGADPGTFGYVVMCTPIWLVYLIKPRNRLLGASLCLLSIALLYVVFLAVGPDVWPWMTGIPMGALGAACFLVAILGGSRLQLDQNGFELVEFWWIRSRTAWSSTLGVMQTQRGWTPARIRLDSGRQISFEQTYRMKPAAFGSLLQEFRSRALARRNRY